MMRPLIALILFAGCAWALTATFGAPRPLRTRLGWTAAIVLLPVAGLLAWIARGPRAAPSGGRRA
jgi:hypothetical protein